MHFLVGGEHSCWVPLSERIRHAIMKTPKKHKQQCCMFGEWCFFPLSGQHSICCLCWWLGRSYRAGHFGHFFLLRQPGRSMSRCLVGAPLRAWPRADDCFVSSFVPLNRHIIDLSLPLVSSVHEGCFGSRQCMVDEVSMCGHVSTLSVLAG